MHEELRRSNTIGDYKGIQHFARTTLRNGEIELEAARQICSFINGIRLNFNSAVAFFDYLDFISVTDTTLFPTVAGKQLHSLMDSNFNKMFCEVCLNKIAEAEIIRNDAIHFDATSGRYFIQKHGFPFTAAVFRNVLIQLGALIEQNDGSFQLNERYEVFFAEANKGTKRKMSLETLKERLEQQSAQGEAAELFVLEYERRRISRSSNIERIKRISDIDVTAGYDIVSFENGTSEQYDRFIEVKSYYGQPHFYWSENEIRTAASLGEKYFIYLVNAEKTTNEGYHPSILRNPAEAVLRSENWLMQPTTYWVIPTA